MIGKRVHSHRNSKVLQVVEELAEGLELLEGDASFILRAVQQPVKVHVVFVRVQIRVAEEDLSEVHFGYRFMACGIKISTVSNLLSDFE